MFRFDILETGPVPYDSARDPAEVLGPSFRRVEKVRNVLTDGSLYCLVYNGGEDYWTFPGGGVEAGESIEEAAVRETAEEVGAAVSELRLIGEVREFRAQRGTLQTTSFFASRLESQGVPQLTEEEERLHTRVEWVPAERAERLLEEQEAVLYHRRFSRARDAGMFRMALGDDGFLRREA